jgi:hypothetical protein
MGSMEEIALEDSFKLIHTNLNNKQDKGHFLLANTSFGALFCFNS